MKLNDIVEVEIEKLVFGFDGLARYGDEQFVIFVKIFKVNYENSTNAIGYAKRHNQISTYP